MGYDEMGDSPVNEGDGDADYGDGDSHASYKVGTQPIVHFFIAVKASAATSNFAFNLACSTCPVPPFAPWSLSTPSSWSEPIACTVATVQTEVSVTQQEYQDNRNHGDTDPKTQTRP